MSAITGRGEWATISFSASAASWSGTAGRTISQPASFSAALWLRVARTSRVSVLVMVCTAMGAAPPTTTSPTRTGIDFRRSVNVPLVRALSEAGDLAGRQLVETGADHAGGLERPLEALGHCSARPDDRLAVDPDHVPVLRGVEVRRDGHGADAAIPVADLEGHRLALLGIDLAADVLRPGHPVAVDGEHAVAGLEACRIRRAGWVGDDARDLAGVGVELGHEDAAHHHGGHQEVDGRTAKQDQDPLVR